MSSSKSLAIVMVLLIITQNANSYSCPEYNVDFNLNDISEVDYVSQGESIFWGCSVRFWKLIIYVFCIWQAILRGFGQLEISWGRPSLTHFSTKPSCGPRPPCFKFYQVKGIKNFQKNFFFEIYLITIEVRGNFWQKFQPNFMKF